MKAKIKMAAQAASAINTQSKYKFTSERINWYPGHMKKATNKIENEIHRINLFLEIVDARIPISSHNPQIENLIPTRAKRLVVLNKSDLADRQKTKQFIDYYKSRDIHAISMSATDRAGSDGQKLLNMIRKLGSPTFKSLGSWLMIGGIPNVGKSTIINTLRKTSKSILGRTKSAKVAPTPGLTRGLTHFKISLNPLIYLIDTPGIMPMRIEDNEIGYKLLLCKCIREGAIDKVYLCDYLLFELNEHKQYNYKKILDMKKKTTNIYEIMDAIKVKFQRQKINECADLFLSQYAEGKLGKITLDNVPPYEKKVENLFFILINTVFLL